MDSPSDDLLTDSLPTNEEEEEEEGGEDEEEEEEEQGEEDEEDSLEGQSADGRAGGNSALLSSQIIRAVPSLSASQLLQDKRPLHKEAICWTLSSAKPGNGVEQILPRSTATAAAAAAPSSSSSSSNSSNRDTYWQSDGPQPHTIRIQFGRRVCLSHVCLYLDYTVDESYTPQQISIAAGMTVQDLSCCTRTAVVEFREPVGWCIVPLHQPKDELERVLYDDDDEDDNEEEEEEEADKPSSERPERPVSAFLVQISVLSMHQNGRDTHIREVQLYGPKRSSGDGGGGGRSVGYPLVEATSAASPTKLGDTGAATRPTSPLAANATTGMISFSTTGMTQFSCIR